MADVFTTVTHDSYFDVGEVTGTDESDQFEITIYSRYISNNHISLDREQLKEMVKSLQAILKQTVKEPKE